LIKYKFASDEVIVKFIEQMDKEYFLASNDHIDIFHRPAFLTEIVGFRFIHLRRTLKFIEETFPNFIQLEEDGGLIGLEPILTALLWITGDETYLSLRNLARGEEGNRTSIDMRSVGGKIKEEKLDRPKRGRPKKKKRAPKKKVKSVHHKKSKTPLEEAIEKFKETTKDGD
jgi:hypothetical protein